MFIPVSVLATLLTVTMLTVGRFAKVGLRTKAWTLTLGLGAQLFMVLWTGFHMPTVGIAVAGGLLLAYNVAVFGTHLWEVRDKLRQERKGE